MIAHLLKLLLMSDDLPSKLLPVIAHLPIKLLPMSNHLPAKLLSMISHLPIKHLPMSNYLPAKLLPIIFHLASVHQTSADERSYARQTKDEQTMCKSF